jgi:predicted peptidase
MHPTLLALMTLLLVPSPHRPGRSPADTVATGFLDRAVRVDGLDYPYQVYLPRNYDARRRWPVILFLHGSGERGSDGLLQTEVGLGPAIRRGADRYRAIVVMPQAPADSSWQGRPGEAAMAALDATLEEFSADPERVTLTGMSLGGNGTWYLAYHHPDRFAALAPVCGWVAERGRLPAIPDEGPGTPYARVAERIRDLPIWIFHGDQDTAVPVEESRRMAEALEAAGADVRYTEIWGGNHNAWDPAYRSAELAAWLTGGDGADDT